jgi:hypothetical protein
LQEWIPEPDHICCISMVLAASIQFFFEEILARKAVHAPLDNKAAESASNRSCNVGLRYN